MSHQINEFQSQGWNPSSLTVWSQQCWLTCLLVRAWHLLSGSILSVVILSILELLVARLHFTLPFLLSSPMTLTCWGKAGSSSYWLSSAYFYCCSTFCVKSRFPDRLVGRSVAECLPNTKKTLRSNPSTTQNPDFSRHRSRRLAHLGGDRRLWKWMVDDGDTLCTCMELSEDTKFLLFF